MELLLTQTQNCWQVRKCPASQRKECNAYTISKNCWEEKSIPCCKRNDKKRCSSCVLYHTCISKNLPLFVGCKNFCEKDYQKCTAYIKGKNCWEANGKLPCCEKKRIDCKHCTQYLQILIQLGLEE